MQNNKKKSKMWGINSILFITIQLVCSAGFVYLVKDLLPMKYWSVVAAVLAVLLLTFGTAFAGFSKKIKKKNKGKVGISISWILSVALSVGLAFGMNVVYQGLDTLNNVTNVTYQSHVLSLIVSNDSSYQTLADLEGKTIGIVQGQDEENMQKALDQIQNTEKVAVTSISYASMVEVYTALMNGEIDAMLLNEAYSLVIDEIFSDYSNSIRVIYQFEIQEEIELVDGVQGDDIQELIPEEEDIQPEVEVKVERDENIVVTEDTFNIFISGIDTYGSVSTVSRSDVNMIVTVNPKTKQILMTSIPRDYYVKLASKGAYDKLTHAGIYGVNESVNTLENLFGIQIDYYVKVNFTSLINVVDALGGITVYNPTAFTGTHNNKYYPEGNVEMDGESALAFVRERYSLAGGDNARIKNQQRVLTGIIQKAISPAIITNYSGILSAVSGSFVTNLSSEEIQSLIQMQLNDMSSWNIEQISVTGSNSSSTNCYSMKGYSLYVMQPNYSSVSSATSQINALF